MHLYGLIGESLKHSFSKKYFTDKFEKEKLQAISYKLFPLKQINEFPGLVSRERNLRGLNVTIPYKELIIQYMDELDYVSSEIQAVNTIKIIKKNNHLKLLGFNTDVYGFRTSIEQFLRKNHTKAIVLGSGGASKAICFVLKELGIEFVIISRIKQYKYLTYQETDKILIENSHLIINCTPLGMYPEIHTKPSIEYDGIGKHHILYDLVYNPEESLFLSEGNKRGAICINGYDMLVKQAERSWQIWNTED